MKIKVHRGHDQIGGSVTEISTNHTKILVDFGDELYPHQKIDTTEVLRDCNVVFLTHYHGDHLGLYKKIPSHIPVYIGGVAKKIFSILVSRVDHDGLQFVERFIELSLLDKVTVGDIEITPLLVDHSAFDPYMFLIKADGKTVLHTGDFRGHGFRSKGLYPTLQKHVGKVDALIIEGTNLAMLAHKDVYRLFL